MGPMHHATYVIETPDGEREFARATSAADYLLDGGFANSDREPRWHLVWCLERMDPGEPIDVGVARVYLIRG